MFVRDLTKFPTIAPETNSWIEAQKYMMATSGERPNKIRKLSPAQDADASKDGNAVPQFAESEPRSHGVKSENVISAEPENSKSEESRTNGVSKRSAEELDNVGDRVPVITEGQVSDQTAMSKSQLKKIRKKEERAAGREAWKAEKRARDKEKKARKYAAKAAAKAAESSSTAPAASEPLKRSYFRPVQVPLTFVLDCDFDELMTDKEIASLSSQLTRCYSDNKSSKLRSHLVVSSLRGQLKERFETLLSNNHLGWKGVHFTDKDFVSAAEDAHILMYGETGGRLAGALLNGVTKEQLAQSISKTSVATEEEKSSVTASEVNTDAKEDTTAAAGSVKFVPGPDEIMPPSSSSPSIVYLSSDSPNTLDVLSPYTTYIVGGIVDKNRHKGLCYKRARDKGIPTAKLPIGDYMTMQSRTVLATNHVVEIMVKWLEVGDWGEAFVQVIPKRKEAKLKRHRKGAAPVEGGDQETGNKEGGDGDGQESGDDDGIAGSVAEGGEPSQREVVTQSGEDEETEAPALA